MAILLTVAEQIARMRADLRMGVPILVSNGATVWMAAAVETLHADRLKHFRDYSSTLELAITERRAKTLSARVYDGDLARILVPNAADIGWLRSVADPVDDLQNPMKGPFAPIREGDCEPHRLVLMICKQARLLPAAVLVQITAEAANELSYLHRLPLESIGPCLRKSSPLALVSAANVPLSVSKQVKVHVFRPDDGGIEHYAMVIGSPLRSEPVLSRLHSACFTGDILGSLKCDCGPQLSAAMHQIAAYGSGVLLYMNQEGRGIGLANKMRAYALQAQGFDTVEANHRLGFEDDERDFMLGAEMLKSLGFSAVRLMTNNPKKVERMNAAGVTVVERVPLQVGHNPLNKDYLATKAKKSGHLL
ncbi:MAG: GTP cyclohydrolase II [Proteobacteria bacterium]|nr:GTP cyclohydrolase II [Pseudomonadota bacterium]